jgi:hypothetical protein
MKKLVHRLFSIISTGLHFGFSYMIRYNIVGRFKGYKYKQSVILRYLKNKYEYKIASLEEYCKDVKDTTITDDMPIWICWWQGEEKMPPIVKSCYQSILRNAGPHPVRLITFDNYIEFITFPDYIMYDVEIKKISLTHLSDILRFGLLAAYGGLWMDATIYLTETIDVSGKKFFTLKQHPMDDVYVSEYRWSGFCLGGGKNNILFNCMNILLLEYWKTNDKLIDYFYVDYFIALLYKRLHSVKKIIDDNPYSNPQLYFLHLHLKEKFDTRQFKDICVTTSIHKLTWKGKFEEIDSNDEPTYYHYIINN